MTRSQVAFGALILAQVAHSIEEYWGRLWESFPPARFLAGLISNNHELGFIVINASLIAFGLWCFVWPVRREWRYAGQVVAGWAAIEIINGVGHPVWSLREGRYTPGVVTAPLLLALAVYLVWILRDKATLTVKA
jgi:hypothetical protein